MPFKILFTPSARDELHSFRKNEQVHIIEEIENQLTYEPMQETRNRKHIRPNALAEWELRVDKFRVFYDADSETVRIIALGYKTGNRLFINGKEFDL